MYLNKLAHQIALTILVNYSYYATKMSLEFKNQDACVYVDSIEI